MKVSGICSRLQCANEQPEQPCIPRRPGPGRGRAGGRCGTMGHMTGPYDTGRFAQVDNLDQVNSHTDLAHIVQQMLSDLLAHPGAWENTTLDRFLDALAASLEGLPGRYANRGEQFPGAPTWKTLAEVLVTASGYE